MNTFHRGFRAILSLLFFGTGSAKAEQPASTDVRLKMSASSSNNKGSRSESREVMIVADKPGFVHLWNYYGDDPLVAPLLPGPEGTSYFRKVAYEAREAGGQSGAAAFTYRIIAGSGEKEPTETVELWDHRHISYDDFAKGLRGIEDPSGACLRGVPLDLTPLGDEALLMEVTDTPAVSREMPWVLHIWHPTYPSRPELPSGLETLGVQIGYLITTPSSDGQKLGRISQRDGKFIAHLSYNYGSSTSGLNGAIIPERAVNFDVRGFCSVVMPVAGVLTTNQDMMPFLISQLRKDMKGNKWEGMLKE